MKGNVFGKVSWGSGTVKMMGGGLGKLLEMYSIYRHTKNDQQRPIFRSGFARTGIMTDGPQVYWISPVTPARSRRGGLTRLSRDPLAVHWDQFRIENSAKLHLPLDALCFFFSDPRNHDDLGNHGESWQKYWTLWTKLLKIYKKGRLIFVVIVPLSIILFCPIPPQGMSFTWKWWVHFISYFYWLFTCWINQKNDLAMKQFHGVGKTKTKYSKKKPKNKKTTLLPHIPMLFSYSVSFQKPQKFPPS